MSPPAQAEIEEQALAISREGITALLGEHEYPGHQPGPIHTRWSLEDMAEVLVLEGELTTRDLLEFFIASDHHQPSLDNFREGHERAWWDEYGRAHLERLPGFEPVDDDSTRSAWRYDPEADAVDPAALDDDHVRPLEEFRNDPEVRADRVLDRAGYDRRSDEREMILTIWSRLRDTSATTEDLRDRRDLRKSDLTWGDVESVLEKLPGIEREENTPPSPDEIQIETYADVLDARDAVNQDPEVVWSFTGAE